MAARKRKKTAPAPALTQAQEAHARLFMAFQNAERFAGTSAALAQREALGECAAFISALAVGAGSRADWGRLVRMRDEMANYDEVKRLRVVQHVREALKSQDAENRGGNLRFLLARIDPRFSSVTDADFQTELDSRGKRGPHAIAARLSVKCNAFGDREPAKGVAKKYDSAERALKASSAPKSQQ